MEEGSAIPALYCPACLLPLYGATTCPASSILSAFAGRAQLRLGHAKALYLAAAEARNPGPFEEVLSIFRNFGEATT